MFPTTARDPTSPANLERRRRRAGVSVGQVEQWAAIAPALLLARQVASIAFRPAIVEPRPADTRLKAAGAMGCARSKARVGDPDRGRQAEAIGRIAMELRCRDHWLLQPMALAGRGCRRRCQQGRTSYNHHARFGEEHHAEIQAAESVGPYLTSPSRDPQACAACAPDRSTASATPSRVNLERSAIAARNQGLPKKTVVSNWYPQLSQAHKWRTHCSLTCSDHSGASNASPHWAHLLK